MPKKKTEKKQQKKPETAPQKDLQAPTKIPPSTKKEAPQEKTEPWKTEINQLEQKVGQGFMTMAQQVDERFKTLEDAMQQLITRLGGSNPQTTQTGTPGSTPKGSPKLNIQGLSQIAEMIGLKPSPIQQFVNQLSAFRQVQNLMQPEPSPVEKIMQLGFMRWMSKQRLVTEEEIRDAFKPKGKESPE